MKLLSILLLILALSIPVNGNLSSSTNQADYIIITVPQFAQSLQELVDYRINDGFTVKIIFVDEIYSEFKGKRRSDKIRSFVSEALTYWKEPRPKYLLLAGDVEFVPSSRDTSDNSAFTERGEDSVSIDVWYAINKFENDLKPDIALGRIPCNNDFELETSINKIKLYEDNLNLLNKNAVVLSDKKDGYAFDGVAANFGELFEEKSYSVLYLSGYTESNIEILRKNLISRLNSGVNHFVYVGHGNPFLLSQYRIFDVNYIDSLNNYDQPYIFSGVGCSQNFDLDTDSTLIEKSLFKVNGGCVAYLGSSGLNFLYSSRDFLKPFYDNSLSQVRQRIGECLLSTQRSLLEHHFELHKRFTLTGDPALKINPDFILSSNTDLSPRLFTLEQNYPNPFNPTTEIGFSIAKSEFVTLTVYDILGKEVEILINENLEAGFHTITFEASHLATGIYLYKLQAGNHVRIKKMTLVK